MIVRMMSGILSVAAFALASPAHAASNMAVLISDVGEQGEDGAILVELRILNEGREPEIFSLPGHIEARLEHAGESQPVWLERGPESPDDLNLSPGGFGRARYRFHAPDGQRLDGARLSIPSWSAREASITLRSRDAASRMAGVQRASGKQDDRAPQAAPPLSDRSAGNAFLANLSAYEPIYAVYGPGTNSEARIQVSFKYQLFGSRRSAGLPHSWRDGLYFAYTQRMFWDLGAQSSPFRNVDYQPEIFYLTPAATFLNGVSFNTQAGIRHESNGRDGEASRSINSIYVAPMAAIPLGGGYRLSFAPRLSFFIGDKSDNPDIRRYRGNTGLFMEIGEDEGIRLSTSARLNFGSGKGAIGTDISYPLPRLLGGGPDFYLFGQSFIGYGENLLDYNRRITRFRIGLALVR